MIGCTSFPLYVAPGCGTLAKSKNVGVMSVTNTKLLIMFLLAALIAAVAVVVGDAMVEGSLIINGGLVGPSYVLVLYPDNGATDR
jgi:hypothetical protein